MKRLLVIYLLSLVQIFSFAQDVSQHTERKKSLEQEIQFIDNQLKDVVKRQKATTQQLSLIQKQVANRKALLSGIDKEIAEISTKIKNKNQEIALAQRELDTLETYYNKLVYNTYKNRDTKVWFMYILSGEGIGQGFRRYSYLKNLSNVVEEQATNVKKLQAKLQKDKEELTKMKSNQVALRNVQEKEYKKLKADEAQSQKLVNSLSKNKKQIMSELSKKRKEVEKLNKEIEKILKKSVTEQTKDQTKVDYTLAGMFEQNKGKLPWPVKQGSVTEKFGVHYHPVYKNIKLPENNGVGILTTKNASVHSVFDGVVKQIIVMPGYNQCVLVQHGTYYTFYCKLEKVTVRPGEEVIAGEELGTLEASGGASMLHFQIWKGTQKQNPELWLKKIF